MSDPLSVAASIIGITATGFTVAQSLYQIADGIGSAGLEVRVYADEIDAFSKLLKAVRAELLRPSSISLNEQSLVKDVIDICNRVLAPLSRLQDTLKPLLVRFRNSSRKLSQFGLRVQWIFAKKSKLLFYREALRGQHRILDTTLGLIILQANEDRSPQNVYILEVSLEHSMTAVNRSLNDSRSVFRPRLGFNKPSLESMLMSNAEPEITRPETESIEQQPVIDAVGQSSNDYQAATEQNTLVQIDRAASLITNEPMDELSQAELQNIDEQIEQDLDPDSQVSAHEVLEDMRVVSRKVLRFAEGVLRSSREDTTIPVPASSFPTENWARNGRVPPPPPTEFEYERLPDNRRTMRLLVLLSSSPENPEIDCNLRVVDVNLKHLTTTSIGTEYEALSWCSDVAQTTSYIKIRKNGRIYSKRVSPDLVAALKALRQPQEDRYLWIDAICINHANVSEKNHQVAMMPTIYGQAKNVCVWLGNGDASSAMAFKFIQKEILQLRSFDELCETNEASKKWGALFDLMQHQWFSRRSAIQEIALARDITIYCGADRTLWQDFVAAVELLVEETATNRLAEAMRKDPQFYHVLGRLEYISALGASLLVEATSKLFRDTGFISSPKHTHDESLRLVAARPDRQPLLSLEHLVSSLSIFDVTVAHDTIYALLTIAKDTTPSASDSEPTTKNTQALGDSTARKPYIKSSELLLDRTKSALEDFTQRKRYMVAYESPYADVCKTFIQFCLWQSDPTRALDIICRPWASEDKNPEKTFFYENRPIPKDLNMRLPSWISQLSGAPYTMYAHAGAHTLKMGRKNADTLVGLPTTLQRNYSAARTCGIDKRTLRFKKRINHNMHFSMYVKGFVLNEVEQVFPASQGGAIPQEWIDIIGWKDVDKSDPPDEFWRTLVANRGSDGRNPPIYYARACKEAFSKGDLRSRVISTTDLINNEPSSVVARFCRRVQAVIWNRSLIKTKSTQTMSNNIGLVNKSVLKGDLVCILYGCSVPVILRRCEYKKTPAEIAQEREEDFINILKYIQRRWKRVFERNRSARIIRTSRLLVKLMRRSGMEFNIDDPIVKFYIVRKYGMRWRRIAKARTLARREEMEMGEGKSGAREETPGTSDKSEELEKTSLGDSGPSTESHEQGEDLPTKDGRKMQQSPRLSPPTDDDVQAEKGKIKEEVAKAWDRRFKAWLAKLPEGEEDERWYYYQFLGEAYVHGMMDGEAIEYQNTQKIKTQLFELR